MAKTLVKCKIVTEDDGRAVVLYFWKKWWWIFGHWYPFGTSSASDRKDVSRINDNAVSAVLFDNFVTASSIYGG